MEIHFQGRAGDGSPLAELQKKIEWSQFFVKHSGAGRGVWVYFCGVEPILVEPSAPKHPHSRGRCPPDSSLLLLLQRSGAG